jgi:hypothetical protein
MYQPDAVRLGKEAYAGGLVESTHGYFSSLRLMAKELEAPLPSQPVGLPRGVISVPSLAFADAHAKLAIAQPG